ncbi:MAG: hypothetical protein ACRDEA_11455 [Microcystaceae cyanobacterium]
METARIYTLLAIENHLILVFYTEKRGYQFRVLTPGGEVLGNQDIFDSQEAALLEARKWLT